MNNQTTLGTMTIFLTLLTLLSIDGLVYGLKYGPSLTSLPSPVLKLGDYPNYSVLVPLTRHKISAYPYELAQEDARWRDIKAIIKAPEGFRVMMVIQVLYLGLGYEESLEKYIREMGVKSCVDSIQIFEHGNLVQEICGSVNYTDKSAHPGSLSGPRNFLSKGSSLIVGIQFAKPLRESSESQWLHLEYRHKVDIWNRKFSLAIAFTAFKECEQVSKFSKDTASFRPCSGDTSFVEGHTHSDVDLHGNYCINSHLFCDGVMNCGTSPTVNDTVGADETQDCSSGQNSDKNVQLPSPMISFRPQDQYHVFDQLDTTTGPPVDIGVNNHNNNFHHADLSLGPSSTVLLIVLTILSVMILGVTIRLCCTKCAGTHPPRAPRLSTVSETASSGSAWTVSPMHGSHQNGGSSFFPSFVVHSQCSRFDAEKDFPPSYEDLFPVEPPKSETDIQLAPVPNSVEVENETEMQERSGRNNNSIVENQNEQETTLGLTNNNNSDDPPKNSAEISIQENS